MTDLQYNIKWEEQELARLRGLVKYHEEKKLEAAYRAAMQATLVENIREQQAREVRA